MSRKYRPSREPRAQVRSEPPKNGGPWRLRVLATSSEKGVSGVLPLSRGGGVDEVAGFGGDFDAVFFVFHEKAEGVLHDRRVEGAGAEDDEGTRPVDRFGNRRGLAQVHHPD